MKMSLPFGHSASGRSYWVRSSVYVALTFFFRGTAFYMCLSWSWLGGVSSCESGVCSS